MVRYSVPDRYRKPLLISVGAIIAAAGLLVATGIFLAGLYAALHDHTRQTLDQYLDLRTTVLRTLSVIDETVTALPCSDPYFEQLRQVAYLPDGINEFFHIVDGRAVCSVNRGMLDPPYDLGTPEIELGNEQRMLLWLDRDLSFVGLDGITGSIVKRGDTALVVPIQPLRINTPDWLDHQILVRSASLDLWHRSGIEGLFASAANQSNAFMPAKGGLYQTLCDPIGLHCVATRADLGGYLMATARDTFATFLVIMVCAGGLIWLLMAYMRHRWSFPERFRRNLEGGIVCVYQPIVDLRTGSIIGCEVLARWRDGDGTLAFPDSFLPLVERDNLTVRLSHAVVLQAVSALGSRVTQKPFQVNFNIFPRDFDMQSLEQIFPPSLDYAGLSLVAELVEIETLPVDHIQAAIAYLASRGISTYIDDFGTGYSNLQNLALLDIDGVKIDRSFAMAPKNSMMERIMDHAIEMASDLGRVTIIEGVETRERYGMLKANPQVGCVQGYFVSRPLEIDDFIAFMQKWTPPDEPVTSQRD